MARSMWGVWCNEKPVEKRPNPDEGGPVLSRVAAHRVLLGLWHHGSQREKHESAR